MELLCLLYAKSLGEFGGTPPHQSALGKIFHDTDSYVEPVDVFFLVELPCWVLTWHHTSDLLTMTALPRHRGIRLRPTGVIRDVPGRYVLGDELRMV